MDTEYSGIGKSASLGNFLFNVPSSSDDFCVNRDVLVCRLRRILRSEGSMGAVIEGDRGSGKRHAVEMAVSTEAYVGSIYRLAGTHYGQELEFGALHFLLVDLQDDQIMSPVIVFSELRKRFASGPSKPLFIIENLTFMDPWSISVLSQLVQSGLILLFVIDDKEIALNEDVLGLVRSETLEHWLVQPLTFIETENKIRTSLGLSPSSLATASLWTYSAGNAEWLDALLSDGMEQGNLVRSGDFLVMATNDIPAGRRMLDVTRAWLDRLSFVQRQVLEVVASGGTISPRLLEPQQFAEIDRLLESGLLESVNLPANGIRLTSRVLDDCLRSMLDLERSVDTAGRPKKPYFFDTGLRLANPLPPQGHLASEFELSIRDMVHDGQLEQALYRVSQERAQSFGILPDGAGDRNGFCKRTEEGLRLLTLELQLALRVGDLCLADRLTTALYPISNDFYLHQLSSHEIHEAATTLIEALVRFNRGPEAMVLITRLTDVCLQRSAQGNELETEVSMSYTVRSLLVACLTLGEWESCSNLVSWVSEGHLRDPNLVAFSTIVGGILEALSGDSESARAKLAPAERQLALTGPLADHDAILGILAYCQKATGSSADAAHHLHTDTTAESTSTCFGWVAQFFRNMSVSRMYSPEYGRQRLLGLFEGSIDQEESLLHLHTLALLLRMGDLEVASELQDICQGNPNIFAEAYGLLADGVLEKKSVSIVHGLQILIDLGFAEYAGELDNHLYLLISSSQQRLIARSRSAQRPTVMEDTETPQGSMDQFRIFDLLTKRERYVAAAAARGMSNLEIANKASVSVRTVEGHLYQVYSKLTIQGRSELHNLAASLIRKPVESHV